MNGTNIPEIKIGREIHTLKEFDISGFIRVMDSNSFIWNVDHGGVLNLVDCVVTDHSNSPPFRDKDNVVSF